MRIKLQPEWFVRHDELELVAGSVDGGRHGLDRGVDNRLEGHRFAPQCNFTGRNSRDVQQVIDKAYESSHLTVDDSECLLCGLIERRLFDRRQRVADSRDGIAE